MNINELLNTIHNNNDTGFFTELYDNYDKLPDQNSNRWVGEVIDNNDTEKLGRVKINIHGVYDNIPELALPWAIPDISFIGNNLGNFIVPEIGTILKGYFDQNDIQKPIYDAVAFNANSINNSRADRIEDYPNKIVFFETLNGDYLTLNKASGETKFKHRTGLSIIIDKDGGITFNTSQISGANFNINCNGTTNIIANNTINMSAKGNVNIDAASGSNVNLGSNSANQLVNNLPICPFGKFAHSINNKNVRC